MIPVSYSETVNSKIMKQGPREYISNLISPKLGLFYGLAMVALMVFGFGGFQFSGIDSVFTIVASQFMGVELTLVQRYMFIVIPVIAIVALVVSVSYTHLVDINTFLSFTYFKLNSIHL